MNAPQYAPLGGTGLHRFRPLIASGSLSSHQYSIIQNLEMQVYPLRADMAILRRFIDSYLNFVDEVEPPPFYFQPAMPCVLLQLMHYPWLSVPTQNLTVFEQHELSFSILLECYAREEGVLVFKQFAVCTPFLYLDRAVSIVAGRELFGLPKIALQFSHVHPPDLPTSPAQQVALQLRVPGPLGDTYVPFIEIYRDPRPFTSARQAPAESLTAVPDAIRAYFESAAQEWYSMLRLPAGGYERARDMQTMGVMGRQILDQAYNQLPLFPLYRLAPPPYLSTADVFLAPSYWDLISLKQVRDAERTELAAFQSVVRSTMYLDRFYDFGWLFNPLGDDPTTDIKINIHNLADQPVIGSLGLDVYAEQGDKDRKISVLKPRFPYWAKADLVYGLGTNLYWRGRYNNWSTCEDPAPCDGVPNRYSTFGGGAQQENPARVVSPEGLVYVAALPLTDNGREQLSTLICKYLRNDRFDFTICHCGHGAPFVWLITRRINDSGGGRGPVSEQEVLLGTFVEWTPKGCDKSVGHAFLVLFALTDSESRTLTHSEMFGRPIVLGKFENLGAAWPWPAVRRLSAPKHRNEADVLDVLALKSSILPVLSSGASPESRELLRIRAIDDLAKPACKTADAKPACPAPSVCFPKTLILVSLVQVVDCRLPDHDSYQAIAMQLMKIKDGTFSARQDYSLHVAFSRYESLPLVRDLGLLVESVEPGPVTTIEWVKAGKHGWFDTPIEEDDSIDFAWRLGASDWQYPEPPEDWLRKLEQLDSTIRTSMLSLQAFIVDFLRQ